MNVHCPACGRRFNKDLFPLGDEAVCPSCEKPFLLSEQPVVEDAAPMDEPLNTSADEPVVKETEQPTPDAEEPLPQPPPVPPLPPPAPSQEAQPGPSRTDSALPATVDRVRVDAVHANVELRPSDTDEVVVKGEARADLKDEAQEIFIQATSGELEVLVPRNMNVRVNTVSGTIRTAKLEGDLELRTVSGNIALAHHSGKVTARSTSGTLWARNLTSPVLDFNTRSGDITLESWDGRGSTVTLENASGDIEIRIDPNTSSFRYVLSTRKGRVSSFLAENKKYRSLEGTVGSGSGLLTAKSITGSVTMDVDYGQTGQRRVQGKVERAKTSSGWQGFFSHLGVYGIMMGMLLAINLLTSPGYLWFIWPALGWGVGVALHLWGVLLPGRARIKVSTPKKRELKRGQAPLWGFMHSLGSFVAVNAFLYFVDYKSDAAISWAYWITLFWGIGMAIKLWFAVLNTASGALSGTPRLTSDVTALRSLNATRWYGFLGHLGVYVIVIGALTALNLIVSPNTIWVVWVAAAWGIAITTSGWAAVMTSAEYMLAPKDGPPPKVSAAEVPPSKLAFMPVVLLNLSLWAAFALAGFAMPVFGDAIVDSGGVLPEAVGVIREIGFFAAEFPFVYWGVALLASIIGLTAFAATSREKHKGLNLLYYGLAAAFVCASAFMVVALSSCLGVVTG